MKRRFRIYAEAEAVIEIDQAVIDVVNDEWRQYLYDLETPEEIAGMIGRCMIRGWTLSQMDGWADQPDENAEFVEWPEWDARAVEIETI